MAAFAKEINATSIELTKFAQNPGLDSLKNLLDYFFDVEITGGILGAVRDSITHDAPTIIKEINSIEEEIKELQKTGAGGAGIVIEQDLQRLAELREELAAFRSEAIIASENAARAAHQAIRAGAGSPTSPATSSNTESGVNVTRYERSTAENTERTADTLEDQSTAYKGYFENLEETLKNDVTGGITKYIQQLIYAQELATQSISEAVQAGIGIASRDSSGGSTASWAGRQFKVKVGGDIQQTVYDPRVHGSPEDFANLGLSTGGLKMNYAGMFAEGGSFIAPGNQTGDTTRLLMDVNGGERVTVSPAGDSGKSIVLNFYAAQGENEATMRQRARKAGEEIGRQLARA
jgi:hypothetical protein